MAHACIEDVHSTTMPDSPDLTTTGMRAIAARWTQEVGSLLARDLTAALDRSHDADELLELADAIDRKARRQGAEGGRK